VRIIFIGDIVGKGGRRVIKTLLPEIIDKERIDLVIANVENLAGGFGITVKTFDEIVKSGVDVGTGGNHIWDNKEYREVFENFKERVLRPANYPPDTPGDGYTLVKVNEIDVGIINLQGRIFMDPIDCPFRKADEVLDKMKNVKIKIVDFHAEATSEKKAMFFYLDGRVSAVFGTHTHIQTADEVVSLKGTAYITDVGMTGSFDSVLGVRKEDAMEKLIKKLPTKFRQATGDLRLNSVIIEVDEKSGKTLKIERFNKNLKEGVNDGKEA